MQQQQIQNISSRPSESTSLSDKSELKILLTTKKRWEMLDTGIDALSFFLSLYSVIFAFAYLLLSRSQFMMTSCACSVTMTLGVLLRCHSKRQQQKLNNRIMEISVEIEVKERLGELQLFTFRHNPYRDTARESDLVKRKRKESVQSFRNLSVSLERSDTDAGVSNLPTSAASTLACCEDISSNVATASTSSSAGEQDVADWQTRVGRDILFRSQNLSRRTTTVRFEEIPQIASPASSEESSASKRNKIVPSGGPSV